MRDNLCRACSTHLKIDYCSKHSLGTKVVSGGGGGGFISGISCRSTVTPSLFRASVHVSAYIFFFGQKWSKIMSRLCGKPVPQVPTIFSLQICRFFAGKFLLTITFIWDTLIIALIFIHLCSGQLGMSTFRDM